MTNDQPEYSLDDIQDVCQHMATCRRMLREPRQTQIGERIDGELKRCIEALLPGSVFVRMTAPPYYPDSYYEMHTDDRRPRHTQQGHELGPGEVPDYSESYVQNICYYLAMCRQMLRDRRQPRVGELMDKHLETCIEMLLPGTAVPWEADPPYHPSAYYLIDESKE